MMRHPDAGPTARVYIKSRRTPAQMLAARCGLLAALFLLILAIFWFDRDGLRDQIDGEI